MREKPDFKTSFLALMEEGSTGGHPAAEALAAYHGGELDSEEQARVRRHLAACRECAELAEDLDLFTEAAGSAEEGNEFEVAAFLRALKPQLTAERSTPKTSWRLPLAVAASLVLAVAASWWLSSEVTKREMLADFSRPRANDQVIDLIEDRSERSGAPAQTNKMAADAGVVLILTPDNPGDFLVYEAKILDSNDALVERIVDLAKHPRDETFTLSIPPGRLTPGDYRVELYGLSGESADLIAGYPLRVVDPSEAPP